ncbi:hypothetical protein [Intestinibacter sp.]|uniref:hypothetical protein n=1 Tax=Intestinibacter sp. TaxID=1965304 RepID=UPI002A752066|nr:hypothetical protein [Intestinibacter sp.]MDY2735187.1 hypothetical protein [Intestinibacter sp.]
MATRWQKLRDDLKLKELVNKDKLDPTDIKNFERLNSLEFTCGMCEYMTERKFLCSTGDINYCRQGYANFLNEEVGD